MNIIIIEDEQRAAESLRKMILAIRPATEITGMYDSVTASVAALSAGVKPDLIFMDIQLSDGLCFEIFKAVEIMCPVVFCTAFDEYMMEAFKTKGVDYILKPFSGKEIENALGKVEGLKQFFGNKAMPDLEELLMKLKPTSGKSSFLVFKQQKYTNVATDNIAYFYVKHEVTHLVCFDKEVFTLNQSLGQVEALVSSLQFFRINRQYLVNFKAIREMEHFFQRKIYIKLVVDTAEKLLINKEKTADFFAWMENR